ncbi:hypothetical protein [Mucilaginibacter sp.]|uniref:hypothetical protein n=1 Tax=Mucilaginibacter sp. TaxID=1882438 RepID=UPI003D0D0CA2
MSVSNILYLSIISGAFPVIAAIYNYRHLDKVLKIVAAFLLISVLLDWGLEIASHHHVTNNFPAIHLFIAVNVLFFGAVYYYAFFSPLLKKIAIVLIAAALLAMICSTVFIEDIWEYPSVSNTILSLLLIFFSLVYFYQLFTRQEFVHIEKQGLFWVNAGILFYYSTNIFLFMLFQRMLSEHQEDFYIIHNVTNIIANIIFSVGLLCKPQTTA